MGYHLFLYPFYEGANIFYSILICEGFYLLLLYSHLRGGYHHLLYSNLGGGATIFYSILIWEGSHNRLLFLCEGVPSFTLPLSGEGHYLLLIILLWMGATIFFLLLLCEGGAIIFILCLFGRVLPFITLSFFVSGGRPFFNLRGTVPSFTLFLFVRGYYFYSVLLWKGGYHLLRYPYLGGGCHLLLDPSLCV